MRIKVISDLEELDSISSHWRRLANESEFPSFCSNYSFIRAWWRAFGKSLSLRVVVIEDCGAVRLIAPFYANATDKQLRLIGKDWGDYNSIVFARGDREAVRTLIRWLQSQRDWDKVVLANLPTDSLLLSPFLSAPPSSAPFLRRVRSLANVSQSPASLDVWENFLYVDLSTRREYRKLLEDNSVYRRNRNWFARQGRLTYDCFTDRDTCLSLLPEYFALHRKEWNRLNEGDKATADSAKLSRWFAPEDDSVASPLPLRPNTKYFEYLVEELSPAQIVRYDRLALDGHPVAIHFGFAENGRLYYHKAAYDPHPQFKNHSPGRLLIAHVLRQAIESGLNELDFGLGQHPYKLEYATGVRRTGTLTLHRTVADAARQEFSTCCHALKRRLRSL